MSNNLGAYITNLFINYIKYYFLSGVVLISTAMLMFIIININPNLTEYYFFNFLTKIIPNLSDSIYLDKKGILQLFSWMSLIFLVIIESFKFILRKFFYVTFNFSFKFKLIFISILIFIIYIFCILFTSIKNLSNHLYFFFTFIFGIDILFTFVFLCVSYLSDKFNSLILQNFANQ